MRKWLCFSHGSVAPHWRTTLITKIDWLSFTLTLGEGEPFPSHRMFKAVLNACYDFHNVVGQVLFAGEDFEQRKGRPPYSLGYARADAGCYIFCHPTLPHFLVEITGRGCDKLAGDERASAFLGKVAEHLTRLDVASDMLCETSPLVFAEARDAGRFKSHSEFVSATGTTCYVGSRTSDRYARVYRYNAPHERAHLLRAEHVLKAEQAKATAQAILANGLPAVTVALGRAFGWHGLDWTPDDVSEAEIAVWRPEMHSGKTLFWLNNAVAPAMLKLCREQKFDAAQWLQDNVISKLPASGNL